MHRLDGGVLSLGCQACHLLNLCGGQTRVGGGWSCTARCIGCDQEHCDLVCFGKPSVYCDAVEEVNGFGAKDIGPLLQPLSTPLPRYIPVLQHEYSREGALRVPWAAIPLAAVLKSQRGVLAPVATTPEELCQIFRLSHDTQILLLGTGEDEPIERYWEARRPLELPRVLAELGWGMAVAPNYSLFLDDPRPQHFQNRKRSLLCASEWSAKRIPTAPYLHGLCQSDYQFWLEFLQEHPEVTVIAKEFQTGASEPGRGKWVIEQLALLQDRLKRDLHPLAIGAAQYRIDLARYFKSWTVVDSMPFMRAMHRRKAHRGERRVSWSSAIGEPVDTLLAHNAEVWGRWIEDLVKTDSERKLPPLPKPMKHVGQIPLPLI